MKNDPNVELALLCRNLAMQAKIPAEEKTLKAVLAGLNWLEQIAAGKLIVLSAPPAPTPRDNL